VYDTPLVKTQAAAMLAGYLRWQKVVVGCYSIQFNDRLHPVFFAEINLLIPTQEPAMPAGN
jgi:hypothetical protein